MSTAAGSLSYAVGNDYDNAIPRTLGAGQILLSQWADPATGDTYWVQGRAAASPAARKIVTLNDTRPTTDQSTDQWNFAAVEVKPAATAGPVALVINPVAGQTVSGTIPVAARATDDVALKSVQFLADGRPLGRPVTEPPYAVRWKTIAVTNGAHTLSARVTGTDGSTVAAVRVLVQNPAPPMTCFVMQAEQNSSGRGNDDDRAMLLTLPRGWVALGPWPGTAGRGTYWSQYTNQPVARAGTTVEVTDTSSAAARSNLAAVEVPGEGT